MAVSSFPDVVPAESTEESDWVLLVQKKKKKIIKKIFE
jgi:hypothetical protein